MFAIAVKRSALGITPSFSYTKIAGKKKRGR